MDKDSMYCLAKALKALDRGQEALQTYLQAGKTKAICKLDYSRTCPSDPMALEAEINASLSKELGTPLPMAVWKAEALYELASYLEAAGKSEQSEAANKQGDETINLYCALEKTICRRLKNFMQRKIVSNLKTQPLPH